jgi:hypothetical protein
MRELLHRKWAEFQDGINAIKYDASPRETFVAILVWLAPQQELLASDPFAKYRFNDFFNLDINTMPIETATERGFNFERFRHAVNRYKAQDAKLVAQHLYGTLRRLVVYEVDEDCPACTGSGLAVYKSVNDGRIAFECMICCLGFYADKSRVVGDELTFANNNDLDAANLK